MENNKREENGGTERGRERENIYKGKGETLEERERERLERRNLT